MALSRRWLNRRGLFFAAICLAILAAWLGYHANWIRERRDGWEWLDSHKFNGNVGFGMERRPFLPWSLAVLGEQSGEMYYLVKARDDERGDLPAYQQRVKEIEKLFPESQIIDFE